MGEEKNSIPLVGEGGEATGAVGEVDVLVVGAGIAGTTAALGAAEAGARVALASAGAPFSGSSFFPGTWGLGLVGPLGADGAGDLADAICEVGRGMALPRLVRALVGGIPGAVEALERRGVALRRAERAGERDFIPCFDRSHRAWHGLGRGPYREAIGPALLAAGVLALPRHDLLDLVEGADGVRGALLHDRARGESRLVRARAVVLATGGFGGLFERTLTTPDVTGTAAAVALAHGARLVNAEFIQVMPGLVAPVRDVVFNERTFRYARVEGLSRPDSAELLDQRGGHGPFTASLPDRAVDLAVVAAGERGAKVSYSLPDVLPEFMRTYFDWFEGAFGTSPAEGARIALYAHASNGGILVDEGASTGVPGLFACGEATGGMHGADRIGGLSSANALVFGDIAGRAAAAWASRGAASPADEGGGGNTANGSPAAGEVVRELRRLMAERCLVVRTEEGLRGALAAIEGLGERLEEGTTRADPRCAARTATARQALLSASALVTAMLARTESRGAHFRADHPEQDPSQRRPLVVSLEGGAPVATPLEGPRPGSDPSPSPES